MKKSNSTKISYWLFECTIRQLISGELIVNEEGESYFILFFGKQSDFNLRKYSYLFKISSGNWKISHEFVESSYLAP